MTNLRVSSPTALLLVVLAFALVSFCSPTEAAEQALTVRPKPRGEVRIVYVSDHNSDAKSVLPDTATADHLRGYVDMLAVSGVDIFAQDVFQKHGVGWFWPEHPDHAHFAGQVDNIPRGDGPPVKIAIEQTPTPWRKRFIQSLGEIIATSFLMSCCSRSGTINSGTKRHPVYCTIPTM